MKKLLIFLTLSLTVFNMTVQGASTHGEISLEQALEKISECFDLQQVDVYLKKDSSATDRWTFFIDERPLSGWSHSCCLLDIPKQNALDIQNPKTELRFFPKGDFELISAMPRAESNEYASIVANIPTTKPALNNESSRRTYALILSGGINKYSNNLRYWFDCSFIYKTLVNRYGIPRENIIPVMADGTDPAEDCHTVNTYIPTYPVTYRSQPLDLDQDGTEDIKYAATKQNVQISLNELLSKMNKDDQLFIFVIDHGDKGAVPGQSIICLWNNEELYDYELASMLKPFRDKNIIVNAILGQCFAGGFIDDLSEIGCIVATACSPTEESFACSSIPFDEFVYWWTSGINGKTHNGKIVSADTNSDGYVSMEEAFEFAKANDMFADSSRKDKETPQFSSNPASLGRNLSFDNIPYSTDLFIRDNPSDKGIEPNLSSEVFWDSPDIWLRNADDDHTSHENPIYSLQKPNATVYVKVHNNGWKDYNISDQGIDPLYLHLYWSKTSTAMTKSAWMGFEQYDNNATGRILATPVPLTAIRAGGDTIVKVTWPMTAGIIDSGKGHYVSLFAKINNFCEPEAYLDRGVKFSPVDLKTQAQKNLTLINNDNNMSGVSTFIRNPNGTTEKIYSLEIVERYDPYLYGSGRIFSVADICITMESTLYLNWLKNGTSTPGLKTPTSLGNRTFTFTDNAQRISNISMSGGELDPIRLKVVSKGSTTPSGRTYIFDLIQRDENDNIVGGQTFSYTESSGMVIPIYPELNSTSSSNGDIILKAVIPQSYGNLKWQNANKEVLGTEQELSVMLDTSNSLITASASNEDGDIAYGNIDLANLQLIKEAHIDNNGNTLHIEFLVEPNSATDLLILSAVSNPSISTRTIEILGKSTKLDVDISMYPTGIYAITLYRKGEKIDSIKFNKQ